MGQYFKFVNLSKQQYFSPGILGDSIKFGGLGYGASALALARLICSPGDMDYPAYHRSYGVKGKDELYLGCWAGDQIIIPGDYEKSTEEGRENLYRHVENDPEFEDIGLKLFHWMCKEPDSLAIFIARAKTDKALLDQLKFIAYEEGNKVVAHELEKNFRKRKLMQ